MSSDSLNARKAKASMFIVSGLHCSCYLLARCPQGSDFIPAGVKLHSSHSLVLESNQLAIDILVMDFTGSGLVASRNICNVNQPNQVDVLLQFLDQIPFRNLLVKEIVEQLHLRMVDGPNDFEAFRHRG